MATVNNDVKGGDMKTDTKVESIVIDPYESQPVAFVIMTIMLLAIILWTFGSVFVSNDQRMYLVQCCVTLVVGIAACDYLAAWFGTWLSLGPLGGPPFNNPLQATRARGPRLSKPMTKFTSQFWQLVIHCSMTALEYKALGEQTTILGCDLFTEPWHAQDFSDAVVAKSPLIETLYMWQMGIWMVTAIFHVFVFERQKDYFVMLAHHIVTMLLLGWSWKWNQLRYGLMVLLSHDVSDIPVDLVKMTNYLKLEGPRGLFLTEISFISVLGSWAYYRFFVFGWVIVYQASCHWGFRVVAGIRMSAEEAMAAGYHEGPGSPSDVVRTFLEAAEANLEGSIDNMMTRGQLSVAMMMLLLLMHTWWYSLFLKILFKLIGGDSAHELAGQEYEGSDQDIIEDEKLKEE